MEFIYFLAEISGAGERMTWCKWRKSLIKTLKDGASSKFYR